MGTKVEDKHFGRKYLMAIRAKKDRLTIPRPYLMDRKTEQVRVMPTDKIEVHFALDSDYLEIYTNGTVILKKQVYATGAYLSHTLCRKDLIPL